MNRNCYDEMPYPVLSYTFTHPDHLATLAWLLGMDTAPIEKCRVLEVGCASGGNLIPMASTLPQSEFVGIDFSAQQIASAQGALKVLELENIAFKHMDIMEVDAGLGQFDYIIAHGVFSWVPRPVQDKLLMICKQNLAPNGVAYVSYNTYPGWHMMSAIREMMLYHTRHVSEPQMRVAQARAFLEFLADSVEKKGDSYGNFIGAYGGFLKAEAEHLRASSDSYLLHEELEDVNEPVYFHQFIERAAEQGLQYLCEADFSSVFPNRFPQEVTNALLKMSHDIVEMEQHMDFLRNRTFRKTLLVHQGVSTTRTVKPERLSNLHIASNSRVVSENPDIKSIAIEKFEGYDGATLTVDHPVTKAAMMHLSQVWPATVSFEELLVEAQASLALEAGAAPSPGKQAQDAQVFAINLLRAYTYSGSLVELHVCAPRFVIQASERPVASPWSRWQAQIATGLEPQEALLVTNLRHERIELKGISRYLMCYLDGNHDRAALLDGLTKSLLSGDLVVERENHPITDTEEAKKILVEDLEQTLAWLARMALLVA